VYNELPDNRTPVEGLFLAGEYTESSSIHGAMHSGEKAAKELLRMKVGKS
jgi:phytoene dehydrogenase-like protein